MTSRQIKFDVLRLLAAFFVIVIHVNFDASAYSDIDNYIKSQLRWCVPVFFLMSGYFLRGESIYDAISYRQMGRILKIILVISVLYLPLAVFVGRSLDPLDLLLSGVWFHLWFLNALIISLLILKLSKYIVPNFTALAIISAIILVALHIVDFCVSYENEETTTALVALRFLQGIPMILIGFALRTPHRLLTLPMGCLLFVAGAALCLLESYALFQFGAGGINPQFPIGTLPMTIGIFAIFQNASVFDRLNEKVDANLGNFALQIYLLHPLVLTTLSFAAERVPALKGSVLELQLTLGVLLSFLLTLFLARFLPFVYRILNGDWNILPRRTEKAAV